MMVKFKFLVLTAMIMSSFGIGNSQTRVFDLGDSSFRQVTPVEVMPGVNSQTYSEQENIRLEGKRQEDGTVIFHQMTEEDEDLMFAKEESGRIVDEWGNVIEQPPEPEIQLDPFYRAVVSQNIPQIQLQLANGQNPNQVFDDGNTALHLAANYKNKDLVHILLWYDASLNTRNSEGTTALQQICAHGTVDMLKQAKVYLKNNYVKSLNSQGYMKRNCMHYAALYSKDPLMLDELLNSGMNIKHLASDGQSAMHYLVMTDNWKDLKKLAEFDSELLKVKGSVIVEEKDVEDFMMQRMPILVKLDFLKYFSEENQDLLNEKFNKAGI